MAFAVSVSPRSSSRRFHVAWAALAAAALAPIGCDEDGQGEETSKPALQTAAAVAPASAAGAAVGAGEHRPYAPSRAGCELVEVYAAGSPAGVVCVEDVAARELTVLDLADGWTPRVFAVESATGKSSDYRAKYLELARSPGADLGLYGIAPTLTVLASRLVDEKRRACHAAVDRTPMLDVVATWSTAPDAASRAAVLRSAETRPVVRAIQAELACEGLIKPSTGSGAMSGSTQVGLDAFRRRHMIVGSGVDADMLGALALGGEELAFRGLLRGLRERVADAAGLVEDGSASGERALVVDRELDLSRFAPAWEALDDAAPDLVGAATDVAARELGWSSPDAARAFVAARGKGGLGSLRVAVALPEHPAYLTATMDLSVEIDRGDVFYETPGQAAAARKQLPGARGPSLVLYTKDGATKRPLIRWGTTIGGWKKERTEEGEIALKYKESDVGDRVWRRIVAAPAWMPPDSTPETDLLRENKDGTHVLKGDLIQPGHRNAYGLAMLIHEEARKRGDENLWDDHGIRTHGSVDFRSIGRGESHGCHRLYNQLVLRLSGYLLQHRTHARRGKMHAGYHRTITWNDQTVEVDVPTRGYLYELDPPVPVRVLPGRVAGRAQKPISTLIMLATPDASRG